MRSMAKGEHSFGTEVVRSTLIAIVVTLLLLVVFSVALAFLPIDSMVIPTVNQFIKAISIVIGLVSGLRSGNLAFVKGVIMALLYVILTTSLFFLLGGNLNGIGLVIDLGIALIIGGVIGGIVAAKRN